MAEQFSHDVVDKSGSAGASAPADVAANHEQTQPAGNGNTHSTGDAVSATTKDEADVKAANGLATTSNLAVSDSPQLGDAAEPSAGDAGLRLEGGVVAAEASAEPSIASDTEGSRADAAEKKEKTLVRTDSMKKPTTFSKVSVTKNFMAKSASPTPAAAKTVEKQGPLALAAQTAAAKPRLVAKTASSSQGAQRPSAAQLGGPDASKVWNKNRAAPPPPPKQFTDEELKQQYGIHLATRLQTDEMGKEAKWADIDDDEEDWAPEAVVWMDGTKSTLTPSDVTPVPKEQTPVVQQAVPATETSRPNPLQRKPGELGPQRTILKPGIAAQQAKQQSNGTPVGAPSNDRSSLKSRSPAPAPAKSPWAKLPPVESISPINPPVQTPAQPPPMPSQDARSYEHASVPAREIPADTFSRYTTDSEGAPRELFNSSNGRYEPAPEARRGSIKPDSAARKTALLQRPSQSGQSRAEPSEAFQSRTSGQADALSWSSRRRGSSVSQGSHPPGGRLAPSRSTDLPPALEDDSRQSETPGRELRASPLSARDEEQRPSNPQQSFRERQMPFWPEPRFEESDAVKIQERIMREKREEARKRRQEEEERAEREKRERLQARLAALEGSGKSRKEREAEAAAAAPANLQHDEAKTKANEPSAPVAEAEKTQAAQPSDADPAPPETRPALPTSGSVPAEPPQVKAPAQSAPVDDKVPSPITSRPQPLPSLEDTMASADQGQKQPPRAHLSPGLAARTPFAQPSSAYKAPVSSYPSPGDRKQQPYNRSGFAPNDTFSSWNMSAPNGNVWGTSGIGNGTFERASTFAPVPMSQQNSTLPPPPGMPQPPGSVRISPQAFGQDARSPHLQQQATLEPTRAFPPPGLDSHAETAWGPSRHAGVSPAPGLGRQTHLPGPIAPPSRAAPPQPTASQRAEGITAWNNVAASLPHQYAAEAEAAERKQKEALAAPTQAERREGTIRETFKKTSGTQSGKLGAPRRFEKPEYTVHDAQGSRVVPTHSPAPLNTQSQPSGPVSATSPFSDPWGLHGDSSVRIPEESPNPVHAGLPLQPHPIAPPTAATQPTTFYLGSVNYPTGPLPGIPTGLASAHPPPPPEMAGHPAYTGNERRPNVKLPQPPPVVKLPPAPPQTLTPAPPQQSLATIPPRGQAAWGPPGARPLVQNNEWQARFNGLFKRTTIATEVPPSPPKTPPKAQDTALAIAAASRSAMEEMPESVATVSLPHAQTSRNKVSMEGFTIDDSNAVTSKPAIDDMFEEERSFGSKPTVRVARNPLYDADVYYTTAHYREPVRAAAPADVQTAPDVHVLLPRYAHGIFLSLPRTKLHNKLVRYGGSTSNATRKPVIQHERRTSGKFHTKGKDGKGVGGPSSPAASVSTPNTGTRSTSLQQKASTPSKGPRTRSTPVKAT